VTRRRVTDAVTSLAARTFPPSRRADSRVVRDWARDAVDAAGLGTLARESLSVALAGLRVRFGVCVREVRQAPWRPALAALTLPVAAAFPIVWTFGFVPRYDHWPLGEGWVLLLNGSLLSVIGAAFAVRWIIVLGAAAVFVGAGAPYVGYGTENALSDTSTLFPAHGVDLGAASLIPALLLAGAGLTLPRRRTRSLEAGLDRLVLGLLPTAAALIYLLTRVRPEALLNFPSPELGGRTLAEGSEVAIGPGPPYSAPELIEPGTLLTALGVALLVAVVFGWRAARSRPEAALATALVLVSVAPPFAWRVHEYAAWPAILIPFAVAIALTRRAAHAAHRSSSATPASPSEPAASR
jgi:hypothetical protein